MADAGAAARRAGRAARLGRPAVRPARRDGRPPRAGDERPGGRHRRAVGPRRGASDLHGRDDAAALPEQPAWLAAVGAHGDLGDEGLRLPEAAPAPKTAVRKLVPLVNAPRRLPDGPVATALALLVEHEEPKAILADPRIGELEEARREWRAGFDAVVRTAPRVGGDVAVLRFRSPYQVHPLVATTWARRLAPRMVLAANDDYLPGRVNFAVRGGAKGDDLRARLRAALPDHTGELGNGHARATGGSLNPEEFGRLVAALGVPTAR